MASVEEVTEVLLQLAPLELAEEWDNVGLLIGDRSLPADRVMTCLTVTEGVVAEAIDAGAQLIVTHHPLPFRPLRSITSDDTTGRLLLRLIAHSIAVYSAHTAFDSAATGVNQHLAIGLDLQSIKPLRQSNHGDPEEGAGRCGNMSESTSLTEFARRVQSFLDAKEIRCVGNPDQLVERIAIACGSGGTFLTAAINAQCDVLLTGEASFHHCLDAEASGIGLVLVGHYASERFAMESLADYLSDQVTGARIWASRTERDPFWRP